MRCLELAQNPEKIKSWLVFGTHVPEAYLLTKIPRSGQLSDRKHSEWGAQPSGATVV